MNKIICTRPLDAVLALRRQGLSLIPIGSNKKPLVSWKQFQDQPASRQQIRTWYRTLKPWGWGLVTGSVSGCVVLDVDGDEGFEVLFKRGFHLPATLHVRTPRGGTHFYFDYPGFPTKNFIGGPKDYRLSKVDFRGDGGYAIIPPTPGYEYVEPLPLAPMPNWLKSLTVPGWTQLQEAINSATEGTRNDTGFTLACKLRDGGITTEEGAKPLLQAYASVVGSRGSTAYTQQEALASVESAFSRPPLSPAKNSRRSQASQLIEQVSGQTVFFHDPERTPYVTISHGSHQETLFVKSKAFKQWLCRRAYEQNGEVLRSQTLMDVLTVMEGQALYAGPEHRVFLRIAEHENAIVIDLGNSRWEVIVVDATGWRIEQVSPVKFRRSRGMLALPTPVPGESNDELRKYLNIETDDEWKLAYAWMLYTYRDRGPYPVLCIQGEQGSGKTTTVRILRDLIDPSVSPVRSEPKDGRDLMIAAYNARLLAFDNVSHISPSLSDAICRLATGGGLSTRALYTDSDEVFLDAQRPVILNGIETLITRSDLLDRAIILSLPTIDESQRRTEAHFLQLFEEARPRLFGALLSALSKVLACLPDVHLDRLPRMADFSIWSVACERALGWQPGSFVEAYQRNRASAQSIALDAPIIAPLEELLSKKSSWIGTARELLQALDELAPFGASRPKEWPGTERQLGGQLSRLAPNLRAIGIRVTKDREGHARTRMIKLEREDQGESLSALSALSASQEKQKVRADKDADNRPGQHVRTKAKLRAAADKADKADNKKAPLLPIEPQELHRLNATWRRAKPLKEILEERR